MTGCHGCQERMLDHLYDLLDGAEAKDFRDHLAGCPACQASLEKARAHQQLLASVARQQFPGVRFVAPTETIEPRPVLLLIRPRLAKPRRRLGQWAAVAAVSGPGRTSRTTADPT